MNPEPPATSTREDVDPLFDRNGLAPGASHRPSRRAVRRAVRREPEVLSVAACARSDEHTAVCRSTTTTCHTSRTTYQEKLRPTPTQERALAAVLWRRLDLYNAALEQRPTAWGRSHVAVSRF